MSSGSAGTVYNITLPVGVAPYIPTAAQIAAAAIVATGAGVTNPPLVDRFISIAVPAGLLGVNGALRITANYSGNGVGGPSAAVGYGAAGISEQHNIAIAVNSGVSYQVIFRNRGVANSQVTTSVTTQEGQGLLGANFQYTSIDSSQQQYVNLASYIGSNTGGAQLESYTIEVLPG